jgi:hypothetical protein
MEFDPVPHEVPFNVSEPKVVVTQEFWSTEIPLAEFVPFAAMPVIVTLPAPVAEMLEEKARETPMEPDPVPHEIPLTVSEPVLVVTQLPFTSTPRALFVPHSAVPVIVTLPAPVAEMLADEVR